MNNFNDLSKTSNVTTVVRPKSYTPEPYIHGIIPIEPIEPETTVAIPDVKFELQQNPSDFGVKKVEKGDITVYNENILELNATNKSDLKKLDTLQFMIYQLATLGLCVNDVVMSEPNDYSNIKNNMNNIINNLNRLNFCNDNYNVPGVASLHILLEYLEKINLRNIVLDTVSMQQSLIGGKGKNLVGGGGRKKGSKKGSKKGTKKGTKKGSKKGSKKKEQKK